MVGRERVVTDSLLHRPNLIIVLCFVGGVIGCCVCGESKREREREREREMFFDTIYSAISFLMKLSQSVM